ncbi:MAG: hypothetical protein A2X25_05620 [Chloroflexi bacterium GWB2_49_20]|nr:MAG: hypothetical protein A2X25_05620 [Chloroflexi bacterium GWB2_49_20]OGN77105.1 MAG: hypothetical protein A2X26_06620 [Chloroflexi bacterium GWC2_49_37]OGN83831.1 MAG: hypothetical protein A2X27_02220 [Chloroflexi bacterium GWD2_49_16]
MNRLIKPIWMTAAVLVLVLSACGGKSTTPDAASVDAIYTQAASTVGAKLTQTASVFTKTPVASPTSIELSTLSATQTPLITNTPEFTSTPLNINTQVQPTQGSCDNMSYVSDVSIPDGSQVAPGSKFVKTWRIRNNGQCTWSTSYRLIYGWSSDSWKEIKQLPPAGVNLTKAVAPGEEYEITVTLVAPVTSGIYQASFRLQNDKGFNFGTILYLLFQVNGTPTP